MPVSRSRSKAANPDTTPTAIAVQTRYLRKLNGLPLAWVSERTGVSEGHLSLFENGLACLSKKKQALVLRVLRSALRDHARQVRAAVRDAVENSNGAMHSSLPCGEPSARQEEGQVRGMRPGPIHRKS